MFGKDECEREAPCINLFTCRLQQKRQCADSKLSFSIVMVVCNKVMHVVYPTISNDVV